MSRTAKIIVTASIVLALGAAVIIFLTLGSGNGQDRTATITVDISVLPDEAVPAVEATLANYTSLNPNITIVTDSAGAGDIAFGRGGASGGGTATGAAAGDGAVVRPWRSLGWRLFSRLPTLADLEGKWRQQLILPLTAAEVDIEEFTIILERGMQEGLIPIALIDDLESDEAWRIYTERLDSSFDDMTVTYPGLAEVLEDLSRGKIMFVFWDDRFLPLIPLQVRPQHRGFVFPGSRYGDNQFFVGRLYWIYASAESAENPDVIALFKYLTSPGVAGAFDRELVGEFFSWPDEAVNEPLPEVSGPGEIID